MLIAPRDEFVELFFQWRAVEGVSFASKRVREIRTHERSHPVLGYLAGKHSRKIQLVQARPLARNDRGDNLFEPEAREEVDSEEVEERCSGDRDECNGFLGDSKTRLSTVEGSSFRRASPAESSSPLSSSSSPSFSISWAVVVTR